MATDPITPKPTPPPTPPTTPPTTPPRAPKLAQIDPPHPLRAALPALGIAALVAAIAAALLLYFSHPRPVADGAILQSSTFTLHTVAQANLGAPGTIAPGEVSDQTYVSCVVRLNSHLQKLPLFIQEENGTLTTADGQQLESSAARAIDIPRFFQAYPTAATIPPAPLPRETKIEPLKSAQGLVLLRFPVSQDVWNHRKSAIVTITFYHQAPLTLSIPSGTSVPSSY